MITIEGLSDDIIGVGGGDLQEELPYQDHKHGDLVAFSDGTLLRIKFDPDGSSNWRITPVHLGTAALRIEQATGEDGSDVATLAGPVRWVAHNHEHHLVPATDPDLPAAWKDLFAGLMLLARAQNNDLSPLQCSHDLLTVNADPARFTPAELALLDQLGFTPDMANEVFCSYKFGSA